MDRVQTTLRLPVELYAVLRRGAVTRGISINAYIALLINRALDINPLS